jgi:polyisoprenoid-binding protein YceI
MKALLATLALLAAATATAQVASWRIDYAASRLSFTAEQAGAAFDGHFGSFDADVGFDPQQLSASHAMVSVDMASVDTANAERDGILRGEGWFETDSFARAQFVADDFVRTDDGFVAHGRLTIRAATVPVELAFTLTQADGRTTLHGSAELDRFAFGLGLGDWANTDWVGQRVHVDVVLVGLPQ